jgi:hypothetical protein
MTDHLELWNKLGKTDPNHTKGFKRAGGFSGTAVKPIYTEQKMTEVFGPAGKGWGMGEPSFQVVPGSDGQVAVYCTVSLWWCDPVAANGAPLVPLNPRTVYGVGGDMVVVKQSAGLRTDDEAFKKAFTDAVGNAMKHLGMSADVHMGLFDDSKYVNERLAESQAEAADDADVIQSNPTSKQHFKTVYDDITACRTLKQLQGAWERHQPVIRILSASHREMLDARKNEMKDWLAEQDAAKADGTPPITTYNFDNTERVAQ